jgi:hypothetical protein
MAARRAIIRLERKFRESCHLSWEICFGAEVGLIRFVHSRSPTIAALRRLTANRLMKSGAAFCAGQFGAAHRIVADCRAAEKS